MDKFNRGISTPLVIGIIAVIVLGGGGVVYYYTTRLQPITQTQQSQNQNSSQECLGGFSTPNKNEQISQKDKYTIKWTMPDGYVYYNLDLLLVDKDNNIVGRVNPGNWVKYDEESLYTWDSKYVSPYGGKFGASNVGPQIEVIPGAYKLRLVYKYTDSKKCPEGEFESNQFQIVKLTDNVGQVTCEENSKYLVVSRDSVDGSDFLVKYKTSKDQVISCDYIVTGTDFELKNQFATFFLALTDNFLVLDMGTAPGPRAFDVYDLNNKKKVYTSGYSYPATTINDIMTYWDPIEEKVTNENCPKLSEYLAGGLGAGIEVHVSLNLSNFTKNNLGEYRCSARQ